MSKIPEPTSIFLFAACLVFSLTAWCSEGWHHPDEHFQLLEPALFKMGSVPVSDLAWEYAARIRPGLQPFIAFFCLKSLFWTGVQDPFYQAFLLRLLSGGLSFGAMFLWLRRLNVQYPVLAGGCSCLLWYGVLLVWFVPYLAVRFSSENWAAFVFLYGLYLITLSPHGKVSVSGGALYVGGFLVGLSFFLRFQMAFCLAGLAAWLIFVQKLRDARWLWLSAGGALSVLTGILADEWLYGHWEMTAMNYFTANITENKAALWGVSPWWFYFPAFFMAALPPVSFLLAAAALYGAFRWPKHVFVWITVPFILLHSAVGHKELRFLFPVVLPFLVIAMLGISSLPAHLVRNRLWKYFTLCCLFINFVALCARMLLPAQEALPTLRYVVRQHRQEAVTLFCVQKNPFNMVGLNTHFYQPADMRIVVLPDIQSLDSCHIPARALLLYPYLRLDRSFQHVTLQPAYAFFPDWITAWNVNDWQSRSRIWRVWQLRSK